MVQGKEYLEERIASFKASCVGGSSLSKPIPLEPCIFHVCSRDAGFSNFFIVGILFQILLFPQKPAVSSNLRGSSWKCQRCAIFFDIKFCIREKFIPAESLSNFTWTRVNLPETRSTESNLKVTIVKYKKKSFNTVKQCRILIRLFSIGIKDFYFRRWYIIVVAKTGALCILWCRHESRDGQNLYLNKILNNE